MPLIDLQSVAANPEWRGWVADRVRDLGFKAEANFEAFPLFFQTSVGILAALLAWWLIHSGQRRAAEENRRIERARVLHELDREYADLMTRKCVVRSARPPSERVDPETMFRFEMLMTRIVPWFERIDRHPEPGQPHVYRYINGARYIRVSKDHYIDALTLHAVTRWSKRVASGLDAGVIDPADVGHMWRHILPWAQGNRFTFMADFFGVSDTTAPLDARRRRLWRWWRRGAEPVAGLIARGGRYLGRRWSEIDDHGRSVRLTVPERWAGDVAPLYRLIRAVILQAIEEERMDVLHYLGLDEGPDHLNSERLDTLIAEVMFHKPRSEGA